MTFLIPNITLCVYFGMNELITRYSPVLNTDAIANVMQILPLRDIAFYYWQHNHLML
jgi:hypothetical protein